MVDSEGPNEDFEIIEDHEVDEIRLIDTDQLSNEAIRILENEEIDIDLKMFQHVFMKIYKFFEGMFDKGPFIDDFHEECEYEQISISFTLLEIAMTEVIDEHGEEITADPVRLFKAFVAQLNQRVTIR